MSNKTVKQLLAAIQSKVDTLEQQDPQRAKKILEAVEGTVDGALRKHKQAKILAKREG